MSSNLALGFAWLSLLFPLVGALVTPVLARVSPTIRDRSAVVFVGLTAASTLMLLPSLFVADALPLEAEHAWLDTPVQLGFGILLDPLSIVLTNVVAVISFFIMLYCLGYMRGDPGRTRFWMLMNTFIGSMLLLVLANNLIFTFVGWKLVGLCSYALIGYYYRDEREHWLGGPPPHPFTTPSACAFKALIVTSLGDMLMLSGILLIYLYSGTLNVLELYRTAPQWVAQMAVEPGIVILVTLLLIAGPLGKSAQFPLHVWLPEAMAGPAPVSALIHAATMVKAGVFFVARLIPIFYYGYWVAGVNEAMYFFVIVAWIGAVTAFLAASQGLVASELKKVLAYSTASQIGFMMLALGVAGYTPHLLADGYTAGIFHLMSHALFKATLFLCAGVVLHAVHSNYIHEMGALRRYLPYTWIFMTLAAFSLMGVPPLPGFWSKDAVLAASLGSQQYLLSALAIITMVLTAFYTVRFLGMVFHGRSSAHIQAQEQGGAHIREGHRTQVFACGALGVGIVAFGVLGLEVEHAMHGLFEVSLTQMIPRATNYIAEATLGNYGMVSPLLVPALCVLAILAGGVPAYFFYISRRWDMSSMLEQSGLLRAVHIFLLEGWYIDKAYHMTFVRGTTQGASFVAKRLETVLDKAYHTTFVRGILRGASFVAKRLETVLDKAYHMALVQGTQRGASFVGQRLEMNMDTAVHLRLAEGTLRGTAALLRFMRSDAPDLSRAISYLVIVVIIVIIVALMRFVV